MVQFDTDDGLLVRQEGSDTRVISRGCNFLFSDSKSDCIIATYLEYVAKARTFFGLRWKLYAGSNVDETEFIEFTKKITLRWMYYYIVNGFPVRITISDWEHPYSWHIIQEIVENRFAKGSTEASFLCAHLIGLTREGYEEWRKKELVW